MTTAEHVVVPLPFGLAAVYVLRPPPPPLPPRSVLDDEPVPWGLLTPEELAALGPPRTDTTTDRRNL